MTGVVTEFYEPAGFGTETAGEGGVEHSFHSTAIADGTRTIEVGAAVEFEVVPGRQGRWEAADLRPAGSTA
jgi:cold shock CspA family protein